MGLNGLSTSRPSPSIPISAATTSASAASSPVASPSSSAAEDLCPGKEYFAPLMGEHLPGDAVGDGTYTRPNAEIGARVLASGLRDLAIPPRKKVAKNNERKKHGGQDRCGEYSENPHILVTVPLSPSKRTDRVTRNNASREQGSHSRRRKTVALVPRLNGGRRPTG